MSKKTNYVIPHTHWDREWRYPIWKNRMLLIQFMDELLELSPKTSVIIPEPSQSYEI